MKTPTNEQAFTSNLGKICKHSGMNMCPDCGLTPEGLEQIILKAQSAKLEEMTRMTHDEGEAGSYNVGYNSALSDVEAIINRVLRDNAN